MLCSVKKEEEPQEKKEAVDVKWGETHTHTHTDGGEMCGAVKRWCESRTEAERPCS